jgi:hypothetical protein
MVPGLAKKEKGLPGKAALLAKCYRPLRGMGDGTGSTELTFSWRGRSKVSQLYVLSRPDFGLKSHTAIFKSKRTWQLPFHRAFSLLRTTF